MPQNLADRGGPPGPYFFGSPTLSALPSSSQLLVYGLVVEAVRKAVRQLRLSIRPLPGQLRLTVSPRTRAATIREVMLRKRTRIRHL